MLAWRPSGLSRTCLTSMALVALAGAVAGCAVTAPLEAYRLQTVRLRTVDALITISHAPREMEVPAAELRQWIDDAVQATRTYYGRFPVEEVHVLVAAADGRGPQSGTTFGLGTPTIRVSVGRASDSADLRRDWMMTHEMIHLAFPRVPAEHHWIEEGLATYVEPIARAQSGQLSAEQVWHELIEGLPQGLPEIGDRGLDYTPTWGRTYWGGALYCLLADVEIRRRTDNRLGLQDALRGVLEAGGNIEKVWPLARALKHADQAVGVPVMSELYEQMRATPVDVDLDTLWLELGVSIRDGRVVFDDEAPLASLRRSITARSTTI